MTSVSIISDVNDPSVAVTKTGFPLEVAREKVFPGRADTAVTAVEHSLFEQVYCGKMTVFRQ